MRTFIAIDIPPSGSITSLYKEISANIMGAGIKYTQPNQNHVTLAFLGEISDEQVNVLHTGLSRILYGKSQITLNLKGLGVFNKNKQPTTLWIGIEPNKELRDLWQNINTCIGNAGINIEAYKKFSPHVTLGRIKSIEENHNILHFVKKYEDADFGKIELTHFTFYQSTLTPEGPVYRSMYTYNLR